MSCFAWFWGFCFAWGGGLWAASGRPGGLHELGLLGGFGVGLTTSLGGVANLALFLAPPGDVVGWALCFDRGFGLWGFWG